MLNVIELDYAKKDMVQAIIELYEAFNFLARLIGLFKKCFFISIKFLALVSVTVLGRTGVLESSLTGYNFP